ncbi:hypothetical protein ACFL9S_17870 [Erwinia sp. AnSW2-5]|uniref:hypothetical protein n=1 Tax=Erwinia sp. AnSW2-5 TaxID=3367692 RepID=UPI00385952E2
MGKHDVTSCERILSGMLQSGYRVCTPGRSQTITPGAITITPGVTVLGKTSKISAVINLNRDRGHTGTALNAQKRQIMADAGVRREADQSLTPCLTMDCLKNTLKLTIPQKLIMITVKWRCLMIKHTTAEREINTSAKLNESQLNLMKRINNLAISLMPEFEDKSQAINAITLDDASLMQLLYTVQLEQKTRVTEYELRKVRRRRENLERFYRELHELGGTLKVNDVADILGITRQAINIRVKKNKLLAFKQNGDFIFPKFQFTDNGLITGFEDVMAAFEEDTHPMLRLGVLKSPIAVNNEGLQKTPIQIMQDGAKNSELSLAIRAAKQFGNHVAS